jgi:hypothetical protein
LKEDDERGLESGEKIVDEEQGRGKEVDYVRTVSAEEFWEQMDGRQECQLGTVAFFAAYIGGELNTSTTTQTKPQTRASRAPKHTEVTVAMIRKIATALDNYDFGMTEKAARSTGLLQSMIRSLTGGLVSVTIRIPEHQLPTEKVEDRQPVEDSAEDTLRQCITHSVQVDKPEWVKKVEPKAEEQPVVNVLMVRKRKNPNPA